MLSNFKNILVLAPHTDDGELGAGGTIHKLASMGCNISYVAFSAAEESVPSEFAKDILRTEVLKATTKLNIPASNVEVLNYGVRNFPENRQKILDDLINIRKNNKFDLVLIPSTSDIHQDHHTLSCEAIRAFKTTSIFGYELIWNNLTSYSTCFVKLSEKNIEAKSHAMIEYHSQSGRDYTSSEFIFSLAKIRGVQIGCEYAECFEVIRLVL
jgi:LmbE family N-acetylglucosaminyl deacetylase